MEHALTTEWSARVGAQPFGMFRCCNSTWRTADSAGFSQNAPRVLALGFAVFCATPLHALSIDDCDRVTHISHGGETDHTDLGGGRVMWTDWWSQEGSAETINITDCKSGDRLRARTQEENMNARAPMDRTEDALDIIARHESGSRIFATLDRIEEDLAKIARDAERSTDTLETCACAALYPEARGDKQAFHLEGL